MSESTGQDSCMGRFLLGKPTPCRSSRIICPFSVLPRLGQIASRIFIHPLRPDLASVPCDASFETSQASSTRQDLGRKHDGRREGETAFAAAGEESRGCLRRCRFARGLVLCVQMGCCCFACVHGVYCVSLLSWFRHIISALRI